MGRGVLLHFNRKYVGFVVHIQGRWCQLWLMVGESLGGESGGDVCVCVCVYMWGGKDGRGGERHSSLCLGLHMPRFSFVPTMNANNNCTHPRRLTRTHVRAHVSPGPTSKFRRPWYCAQCGQLVEPAVSQDTRRVPQGVVTCCTHELAIRYGLC